MINIRKMAIFTRLVDWCCRDNDPKENDPKENDPKENDPKENDPKENIYVKNGITYVKDVKKISDEELEKRVARSFLNLYCHRLITLDKKHKKIVPWDSVRFLRINNLFTKEFLCRIYYQDEFNSNYNYFDLSSLHSHFKVFNRPYTLEVDNGIVVYFIYNVNPVKNSICEYTEEEIKNASNLKQEDADQEFYRLTNYNILTEKILNEYNFEQYTKQEDSNQNHSNQDDIKQEDSNQEVSNYNQTKETDILLELTKPRQRRS
jgi:hypothetical protein